MMCFESKIILVRMLSKLLFCKLYSSDFAVGYQPDINPFTEMPIQEWNLPDIVSHLYLHR